MGLKDVLFDKFIGGIADKTANFYHLHHTRKILNKRLPQIVRERVGEKEIYNDLDKFIYENNLIDKIVEDISAGIDDEMKGMQRFTGTYTERFIEENARFEYARNEIKNLLKELYTIAKRELLNIPQYGENWKSLQQNRIREADSNYQTEQILTDIKEIIEESSGLILQRFERAESVSESEDDSPMIKLYIKKIKEIEEKQKNEEFEEAIEAYTLLSDEVNGKLANEDQTQVNRIRFAIIQNKAICFSNLGETDQALMLLNSIEDHSYTDSSREYHFIFAAVLMQSGRCDRYEEAYEHISKAHSLAPNDDKTGLFLLQIKQVISLEQPEIILQELESRFKNRVESDECESNTKADYYITHGYILNLLREYDGAIEDYKKALEYGYNKTVLEMNIAVTYYCRAFESEAGNDIRLFFDIDYSEFIKAYDILRGIVVENEAHLESPPMRVALQYYLSCCAFLNTDPKLRPVERYMSIKDLDYDSKRVLALFSKESSLPQSAMEFVSESDRKMKEINALINGGETDKAKSLIIELLSKDDGENVRLLYSALLQLCIKENMPEEYWRYKEEAKKKGIFDAASIVMDACVYEVSGDIQKAKELMVEASGKELNYSSLQNIYRFYSRNNFINERDELIQRIHQLNCERAIFIPDNERLYKIFVHDLIDSQSYLVKDILDSIPAGFISEELDWRLKLYYAESINDLSLRAKALHELYLLTEDTQILFGEAYCLMRMGIVDEAYDVIKKISDSNDLKSNLQLWALKSDICLLAGKTDESYQFAKRMHQATEAMPEDASHRFLFSRSLKLSSDEGMSIIGKYKEKHPVVTDWIKVIQFPLDANGEIIDLPDDIKEMLESGKKESDEMASYYKTGLLSIHLFSDIRQIQYSRLLNSFPRIKLIVNHGDLEELTSGQSLFNEKIIVDAMALIFMEHFNIIDDLSKFDEVLVPYNTLEYLQIQKLNDLTETEESKAYDWLFKQTNVKFVADGYCVGLLPNIDTERYGLFSKQFTAAFGNSQRLSIPFLNVDVVSEKYINLLGGGEYKTDLFAHLLPFCYKYLSDDMDKFSETIYRLSIECVFINFNTKILFDLLKKNDYKRIKENLEPFLTCKSDYDMMSFARVYLELLNCLSKENVEAEEEVAFIILCDAKRIWMRGQHYREFSAVNEDCMRRSRAIIQYVGTVIAYIKQTTTYKTSERCQKVVEEIMSTL